MPDDHDFLGTTGVTFDSLDEVVDHIVDEVELNAIQGDLSVVGSISNYPSFDELADVLSPYFDEVETHGRLIHFRSRRDGVPYYLFWDEDFPIWFTTGRKTKDIPKTLGALLKNDRHLGRLWISKAEMETLRARVVEDHPEILMTYFTASRSKHSDVPAVHRPRHKRTIQYYGNDGMETYSEMRHDYGVLPTNMVFKRPGVFKFRVTNHGIFTINDGGLRECLSLIKNATESLKPVKEAIGDSSFKRRENKFSEAQELPTSYPWRIELSRDLRPKDFDAFDQEILKEDWELLKTSFRQSMGEEDPFFAGDLLDENTYSRIAIKSKRDEVRVYPREETGIDQSIRIFDLISDQIDPESTASTVR